MLRGESVENRLFVLDTSVLIHDPESIRSFRNTSVAIPIYVIMELDDLKESKRMDVATSARIVSRRISDIMKIGSLHDPKGVLDPNTNSTFYVIGASREDGGFDGLLSGIGTRKTDLLILKTALRKKKEGFNVVVVTKDVNMRILADSEGLEAEDYDQDKVNPDAVPSGLVTIPHVDTVLSVYQNPLSPSELGCDDLAYNEFVLCGEHLLRLHGDGLLRPVPKSFKNLAIQPRNLEQRMALDLLSDPNVKLVNLIGLAGSGKAQPLDAKVMTPSGWKLMGDIHVGDEVMTPQGTPTKVLGVFPQGEKDIYEVHFSDGTSTECCKEHLWLTQTSRDRDYHRAGTVKSLDEIMGSLRYNDKRNHSIPITQPIRFSEKELPLDPYLLGCLIGDGGMAHQPVLTTGDEEIRNSCALELEKIGCKLTQRSKYDYFIVNAHRIYGGTPDRIQKTDMVTGETTDYDSLRSASRDGYAMWDLYKVCSGKKSSLGGCTWSRVPSDNKSSSIIRNKLEHLGLWGHRSQDKFIPDAYKFGSVEQRVSMLQGLMDTDGTVNRVSGGASFTTTSLKLAEDTRFIVQSLGGTATISSRITQYTYKGVKKNGRRSYTICLCLPNDVAPFRLTRKAIKCTPRTKYYPRRYVDRVEFVGSKQAQCIEVEDKDHLYLTNDFIVTHNTLCALSVAMNALDFAYSKVILSKPVVPMGRDLGYLPGGEDEKLAPWMLSYVDNMDQIFKPDNDVKGRKGSKEKSWEQLIHSKKVEIQPLHTIRGRSIGGAYVIADEIQNCTPHEVKTFVSRAAEGTKVVLCGDPSQIDDSYLDAFTNGLVHSAVNSKGSKIAGTVILRQGVRSELSEFAATRL